MKRKCLNCVEYKDCSDSFVAWIFFIVGVVAAIAIWHGLSPGRYKIDISSSNWECMACGNTFVKKTKESPPIVCPECKAEEAVEVHSRVCSKCGKTTPVFRMRLIESAREEVKDPTHKMVSFIRPLEAQYWIEQDDGNYGWTDWIQMNSMEATDYRRSQKCPNCGESLLRAKRKR